MMMQYPAQSMRNANWRRFKNALWQAPQTLKPLMEYRLLGFRGC